MDNTCEIDPPNADESPAIVLGKSKSLRKPTLKEAIRLYPKLVEIQRARTGGKPNKNTVASNMHAFKQIMNVLGCSLDEPYDAIDMSVMNQVYERLVATGVSKITAKSYLECFRAIFAKWTHFFYEQHGFKVTDVKLPPITLPPCRYHERSAEFKTKVIELYKGLKKKIQMHGSS